MPADLEIIKGSIANDPRLESLSMEVWSGGRQLLRIGRYDGRWKVTFSEAIVIDWEDFSRISQEFGRFIREEDQAIAREKGQR